MISEIDYKKYLHICGWVFSRMYISIIHIYIIFE